MNRSRKIEQKRNKKMLKNLSYELNKQNVIKYLINVIAVKLMIDSLKHKYLKIVFVLLLAVFCY